MLAKFTNFAAVLRKTENYAASQSSRRHLLFGF